MQAGKLNERLTIQSKAVTRAPDGGEVVSWVTVATVWGSARPLSGRELIAARAAQADITTRFSIRYRSGITPAMRVLWRGMAYDITEVLPYPTEDRIDLLGFADAVST
jgi:SPP1 family predicted phage head-tail adaptor